MKMKKICLLICILVITCMPLGITTARNPQSIDTNITNVQGDLGGASDLIKITDKNRDCDMDDYYVVYADSATLYVYTIQTAQTDCVCLNGDIIFPKISENRVVYYDFSYMGFKMYHITTGEKTDLIVTNWTGGEADSFQFFGDYIVYENYDSGLFSTEIFLYNIATSENIQLTDSPGDDYAENPCIYENIVAWQLNEGNLNDIVMYDIASDNYTRVTDTSQFESETFPSIYATNIVYSYSYYDKTNGTILYGLKNFNTTSGDETTIFIGEEPTANSPELFGNTIVYSEPDGRLCLYDVPTSTETLIYENSYLVRPWNLNGKYVVFTVLGEGVYLYNYGTPLAIEIGNITGGLFKVNAVIKNTGSTTATNVQWGIKLTGGLVILGKESTGSIPSIAAGATTDISSNVILGLGKTVLTITADAATKTQNATVLIVFIRI